MQHPGTARSSALRPLVLSLALLRAACAPWDALLGIGLAPGECPGGYYRSSAIVFDCWASRGTGRYLLAPAATTSVVNIPRGVKNLTIQATADTGIGLKLVDQKNGTHIVDCNSRRPSIITSSRGSGSFQGMPILFSGGGGDANDVERLWMNGTSPAATVLRFRNSDSSWTTVTMNYSHNGIENCPIVPEGCELYDEGETNLEVVDWSKWAKSEFESADEAWLMRGAPYALSPSGGVYWHSWPMVWSRKADPTKLDGEDAPSDWQPAFHYLDTDNNGEVSQAEFEVGYEASSPRPSIVSTIITSAAPTTTLTASSASSTSAVPKILGSAGANHSLPAVPEVPKMRADWMERNRGWLIAGCIVVVSVLAGAAVLLLWPRSSRRTRGVRSVRSRDSDGQLELSDGSVASRDLKDLDASFSTGCTDASHLSGSLREPPRWVPNMLMPLLGPFWRLEALPELWRSPTTSPFASGHGWPSSPVRYGPVPTMDDGMMRQQMMGVGPYGPGSPLMMSCHRSPSMETGSVSLSVPEGSSFGPLKVIQASPEQLESLRTAPKVHIMESSTSFSSSPGKAHSFQTPSSPNGVKAAPGSPLAAGRQVAPGSPLAAGRQAPWAAVFTPEEWSRATKRAQQPNLEREATLEWSLAQKKRREQGSPGEDSSP